MRASTIALATLLASAAPLFAQEAEAGGGGGILTPNAGVMFWTLIIFIVLLIILSRFAFKPLTAAVQKREEALRAALEQATSDREEAARLLAEQRAQMDQARAEAQRYIAEGRATGEKMRTDLLEQTRAEQQELLERARREIGMERDKAILELRRAAVDLAVKGASKVIEKNLDDQTNRKLVESFLASLTPAANG